MSCNTGAPQSPPLLSYRKTESLKMIVQQQEIAPLEISPPNSDSGLLEPSTNDVQVPSENLPLMDSCSPKTAAPLTSPPMEEYKTYDVCDVPLGTPRPLRVITIGAGASGINMAFQIQTHMTAVSHVVYEKNAAIGGTWFENRYPGCRCDIPSHNYQFAWAPNPSWSTFYAPHDEIRRYLEECCKQFDLKKYIKTRHTVVGAVWSARKGKWAVTVRDEAEKSEFVDECDFLVDGSGILNNWKWPDIPGLHSFQGDLVHSANWPENLDLKNKTIAVLGTGSSGVQLVPALQPDVRKLVHFIRSPTWVIPPRTEQYSKASNIDLDAGTFSAEQIKTWKNNPEEYLNFCKIIEHETNGKFKILINGSPEQKLAKLYAAAYMSHALGQDDKLKAALIPDFPVGCRRITPAVGYLEALSAPNVQVVTQGIKAVVADGIILADGKDTLIELDALVCATGFDVSFVPRFPLVGLRGNVQDIWRRELPQSYLSIAVPGCPNYFSILGPNAPIGHGSALTIIEHASKYILKFLLKAQAQQIKSLVPSVAATQDFQEHIAAFMPRTAWSAPCRSWFKDGRTGGPVTALHPGSRIHWFHMLEEPRFEDFEWEVLAGNKGNRFAYLGNGFSTKEREGENDTWYLEDPLRL